MAVPFAAPAPVTSGHRPDASPGRRNVVEVGGASPAKNVYTSFMPGARGSRVVGGGHAVPHVCPLRANEVGAAVLPVWLAWKPTVTDAFGAMSALWLTFLTVTSPDAGE